MRNRQYSNNGPVTIQGASVSVRNDDVNGALRKLKKILENDNRQKDLAKHEFFEKPSLAKKREKAAAKKRARKEQSKRESNGTANTPIGVKWMKSKRKRRRVLDANTALANTKRNLR